MQNHSLTYDIVIPVLNEENRLPSGIKKLCAYLDSIPMDNYIITIADNGSTDNTQAVSKSIMLENKKINYINVGKRGVGLALKAAWNASIADVIGYMDVDLATDIHHLETVFSLFETNQADFVNASRNLPNSVVHNRALLRTITSLGYNFILKHFLNVHFTDGMCGFKFLRNSTYKQIKKTGLNNDGWFFCTELLYLAEKSKVRICEIPVKWVDDQDSRVQLFKTIFYYLREIIKLRLKKRKVLNNE